MLKRIFMTVRRGTMDATAVCVMPWEKPLVEELHGGNAEIVTIDKLCNREGVSKTQAVDKVIKLPVRIDQKGNEVKSEVGLSQREQLERMLIVLPEDNPMDDPIGEFARMEQKYGMHPEVKLSVVEKVYGNVRQFRLCMRDFAAGRTPEFLQDFEASDEGERPVSAMSDDEIKAALKKREIKFPKNAKRGMLEELYLGQSADAA